MGRDHIFISRTAASMQGSTAAPRTSPCSKERGSASASPLPPTASGSAHPPPDSTRAPSNVRTAKRTCTARGSRWCGRRGARRRGRACGRGAGAKGVRSARGEGRLSCGVVGGLCVGVGRRGAGWWRAVRELGAHPADSSFVRSLVLVCRLAHDLAHHAASRVGHGLHLGPACQVDVHAQRAPAPAAARQVARRAAERGVLALGHPLEQPAQRGPHLRAARLGTQRRGLRGGHVRAHRQHVGLARGHRRARRVAKLIVDRALVALQRPLPTWLAFGLGLGLGLGLG